MQLLCDLGIGLATEQITGNRQMMTELILFSLHMDTHHPLYQTSVSPQGNNKPLSSAGALRCQQNEP